MFRIDCHGLTDQGRKRKSNQDQFLVASLRKSMTVNFTSIPVDEQARFVSNMDGHLLLVADGMGGHAAGEVASRIAVDSATEYVLNTIPWFYRLSEQCDEDFQEELKNALVYCQERLTSVERNSPEKSGMGTTLTMAYFAARWLYVVHAGDSRCYLVRDGEIHRLTRDHSMAELMVEAGEMKPEEAAVSRLSHCLYNSLGGEARNQVVADISKSELQVGDTVLLCSDGLTRHVSDQEILDVVTSSKTTREKNETLVASANAAGGSDNITVVQAALIAGATIDNESPASEEDTVVLD